VNPWVCLGLTPPKELSLPRLTRMLLPIGQDQEECVRACGQRTSVRGPIAATRAGLPITRAVMPVGPKGLLEMGYYGLTFGARASGQRSSTPSTRGHLFITRQRHLPPRCVVFGRWYRINLDSV
jgi:hypothetical protein